MSEFIQYTLQGLAAGGFYALSALGLAVIFGVLGVVNFSHGACYMLGAVISAVLHTATSASGPPCSSCRSSCSASGSSWSGFSSAGSSRSTRATTSC